MVCTLQVDMILCSLHQFLHFKLFICFAVKPVGELLGTCCTSYSIKNFMVRPFQVGLLCYHTWTIAIMAYFVCSFVQPFTLVSFVSFSVLSLCFLFQFHSFFLAW